MKYMAFLVLVAIMSFAAYMIAKLTNPDISAVPPQPSYTYGGEAHQQPWQQRRAYDPSQTFGPAIDGSQSEDGHREIMQCLNPKNDLDDLVRREDVIDGELVEYNVPRSLTTCAASAPGQNIAMAKTSSQTTAQVELVAVLENIVSRGVKAKRGVSLDDDVTSRLVETHISGVVPTEFVYDSQIRVGCSCVTRVFAGDSVSDNIISNKTAYQSDPRPPTNDNAVPAPQSSVSSALEFDAIIIDGRSLSGFTLSSNLRLLTRENNRLVEVLNISIGNIDFAYIENQVGQLLGSWQAANPYSLTPENSSGTDLIISAPDARALAPIKGLAAQGRVIFRRS